MTTSKKNYWIYSNHWTGIGKKRDCNIFDFLCACERQREEKVAVLIKHRVIQKLIKKIRLR